jgi:glycine hydroxymethyltransferase
LEASVKEISSRSYHEGLFDALKHADRRVYDLVAAEFDRQRDTIQLIAAENRCSRAVLAALGSAVQNKTTEGFPGRRFHAGCGIVDEMEALAVERARQVFHARYADVQPHSGTTANHIVLAALLGPRDRILSLGLDQGGHLSHGAAASFTGRFFEVENYGVDPETFLLDYGRIRRQALEFRPRLIVCGATAYCRTIDFAKFREIADEVGAFVLADVSHISALIAAGAHPSPVDHAHFTTTSTYKPGGPRGGLVLMGRDGDLEVELFGAVRPLWRHLRHATFPGVQGTPYMNNIVAKAVFFKEMLTGDYRQRQFKVVENAGSLAASLLELGHDVLTGGTDNHMVLVNVAGFKGGMTGLVAQQALEHCGIIVNMNKLPYDSKPAAVTSGIRLGTPIVTADGMGAGQMHEIAVMMDEALRSVDARSDTEYGIDPAAAENIRGRVRELRSRFPISF